MRQSSLQLGAHAAVVIDTDEVYPLELMSWQRGRVPLSYSTSEVKGRAHECTCYPVRLSRRNQQDTTSKYMYIWFFDSDTEH